MSKAAKDRLVVSIDGIERHLYSVHEDRKGNLIVTQPVGGKIDLGMEGVLSDLDQVRYTLHVDRVPDQYSFHKHMILKDGRHFVDAAHVDALGGRFIWPLALQQWGDLRAARYSLLARGKDRIHVLGKFNQNTQAVVSVIVITKRDFNETIRPETFLNSLRLDYKVFSFHMWWGYLLISPLSFYGGHELVFRTAERTASDSLSGKTPLRKMSGVLPGQFTTMLNTAMFMLKNILTDKLVSKLPVGSEEAELLARDFPFAIFREPINDLEQKLGPFRVQQF